MTKYIADFILDSDVRLGDDAEPLTWPNNVENFEFTIRNLHPGFARPVEALSAHLVFDAADLVDAREKSQDLLARILNSLVWVTDSMIRINRLIRIVDWTPGRRMRDALILVEDSTHAVSEPLLVPGLIASANDVFGMQGDDKTQSALRWFRLGIAAENLEDQFIHFWFALETAAEKLKSAGKVPTRCTKCDAPLYCEICENHPVHRKFSADAIRDIIIAFSDDEGVGRQIFHDLQKMRHTLLHGRRIDSIASTLSCEPRVATNQLARMARRAILQMGDYSSVQGGELSLQLVASADVIRGRLISGAHVQVASTGNPDAPDLSLLGSVKIELRYPGQPGE